MEGYSPVALLALWHFATGTRVVARFRVAQTLALWHFAPMGRQGLCHVVPPKCQPFSGLKPASMLESVRKDSCAMWLMLELFPVPPLAVPRKEGLAALAPLVQPPFHGPFG